MELLCIFHEIISKGLVCYLVYKMIVYMSWYYPHFKYAETELGERLGDLPKST